MGGLAGGGLVLAGIGLFIGAAITALLSVGGGGPDLQVFADPVVLSVLRFTLWQAGLSTVLSVVLAIPLALAVARQPRFPGRQWLVRLMAVPMGLPVLIGALGLIGIWGRNGLINDMLAGIGLSRFSIYGLEGILLAHVFFNLPLAARLLLAGLERIPAEYWLMSASLGMKSRSVFRFVEWPVLRLLLPGVASLVFMLCATSFTLVLVLGGGPAATTIEVAIYQALRFDFDPPRAVALALMQIVVTSILLLAMTLFPAPQERGQTAGQRPRRLDGESLAARSFDTLMLGLGGLFLGLPLAAIAISGLRSDLLRLVTDPAFLRAGATSLGIALMAGLAAVSVGIAIIRAQAVLQDARRGRFFALAFSGLLSALSSLVLLVPAMVLATGWFLLLRPFGEVGRFAPFVVAAINMLMALPFAMRVLAPAFANHRSQTQRLAASLGITGFARLRLVDWPVLKWPVLMALSFAMALSLGDLGAAALFGSENLTTLPWLIYNRLGNYRSNDADGLALLLGLTCLALTLFGMGKATRGPGGRHD